VREHQSLPKKWRRTGSIRFGHIELDPANAILRKDGVIVKLSAQPLRALALLASRPNELVTREELRQAIWGGDLVVDFEHGLNTCIRQIRTALGEPSASESIIETVPRLGYRFKTTVKRQSGGNVRRWSVGAAAILVFASGLYLVGAWTVQRRALAREDRSRVETVRQASLPKATVGVPYLFRLNRYYPSMATVRTRQGVPVDLTTWAASGLPPGLTIDVGGRISGTPSEAGAYSPKFLLVHRPWYDANGDRLPDCDLGTLTRNGECGDSRTPNPLQMTYGLTVDRVASSTIGPTR
jgi:DNA-binding winged helix-turn-helix (wHTH) protein